MIKIKFYAILMLLVSFATTAKCADAMEGAMEDAMEDAMEGAGDFQKLVKASFCNLHAPDTATTLVQSGRNIEYTANRLQAIELALGISVNETHSLRLLASAAIDMLTADPGNQEDASFTLFCAAIIALAGGHSIYQSEAAGVITGLVAARAHAISLGFDH